MYKQFKEIFNKYNIIKCEQLTKGFNFINIIMSPINMHGSISNKAAFTFDFMITYGFIGKLFAQVQPHDLLKFGIIPELVGRMPVITSLQDLKMDDLVRILREPKNALTKQYEKLQDNNSKYGLLKS